MFNIFALQLIPASGNLQSADDIFVARSSGLNRFLKCIERGSILAIPGEKQSIRSSFHGGLCSSRVEIVQCDKQCRDARLRKRFVFAHKPYPTTTLRSMYLCEQVL